MSTVALRGTLLKDNDEWHWKGMWGFGSNLASVAAQFQQPFWYTFHHAASPHQVAVPGYEEVEEMNATYDVRKATTVTTTATTSGRNVEKLAETDQQETKETIDAKQPTTNNDTKETTTRATDTIKDTEKEGISKDMTATMEESKKELHSEATTNTPANPEFHPDEEMEANKPTFAMVPPGHPSFLDALEKHPNCPPSGHWKGYFSNVARPRDKPQKVQEDFYLCLNGAPGSDVKFTFDESPLPPTVHPESLVLVRGTGTNPFGTFELVGYFDTTTNIMEIQRQYVFVPIAKPKRTRRSPTHKKSYFTRKRQPSWKLKHQHEQPPHHSGKKLKMDGGMEAEIFLPPVATISTALGIDSTPTMIPPSSSTATTTTTATATTTPISLLSADFPDIVPSSSILPASRKRTKAPRKRTPSITSATSATISTPATGVTQTTGNNTNTTMNTTSPFMKLPPVGEPKKARWRAAHFLYYQRHDPDEVLPELSNTTKTSATPNNPRYVVYEGELVHSQREGRGVCLFSNGMLYEGQWKRNKEHGRGQLWTADRKKLIYDGEWERGRMQGQGTYYYDSGKYIGEFKENMRNGMGQYILPDGSVYDGMWSQNKMNGRGVFTWPDLSVYDGEWKDGERHGQGLLKTSDGFVYDGMWVHNAMEGRGIAQYPNGQTYEGLFANGRREGRGTMQFTNGAVYEGRFRDDAVDGQGTMKMSRALIVPNNDEDEDDNNSSCNNNINNPSKIKKPDFMIPISFQSDMTHIHTKAGFTAVGD